MEGTTLPSVEGASVEGTSVEGTKLPKTPGRPKRRLNNRTWNKSGRFCSPKDVANIAKTRIDTPMPTSKKGLKLNIKDN